MASTPSLKGSKIPNGHVLLNHKYIGGSLAKEISTIGMQMLYEESMGVIDCYPSNCCAVIIAFESLIVSEMELSVKLKQLLKYPNKKVVLFEVTETSEQYLKEMQKQSLQKDWDITIILFTAEKEIAIILSQLNRVEKDFCFLKKTSDVPVDNALVEILFSCPGVGEKKALDLLKKFGNLKNIYEATSVQVAEVVGEKIANVIKKKFC